MDRVPTLAVEMHLYIVTVWDLNMTQLAFQTRFMSAYKITRTTKINGATVCM